LILGCSENTPSDNRAEIQLRLTDMPGEYQEVNIDILEVRIIVNDSIIELNTNQGIYNLLEFVNGKDTLLVDDETPGGYFSQIRLILGENNTVMIDSVIYDLKTPSAQQSGLKLKVHDEFIPGEKYAYVIDFVVEKSIVKTGNNKYILKPVIRVYTEAISGSISGVVSPVESKPLVMAILEEDTVSTYADTINGNFMLRGLFEGSYSLEIQAEDPYQDTVLTGIHVVPGQTTLVDTVFIQ